MTPLVSALLGVAVALPLPWYPPGRAPETPAQRVDRVAVIVEAAVRAADPPPGWPYARLWAKFRAAA